MATVAEKPSPFKWVADALTSTIGRKVIMALTGLFLILYLVIHLAGNSLLLRDDQGELFNKYADFMSHALLIQVISIANFSFILLHIITSLILTRRNQSARPVKYVYGNPGANSTWRSRNMMLLGTIILIFLVVHLSNFWYLTKTGQLEPVSYGDEEYHNLYEAVRIAFAEWWIVALYVVSMVGLSFHLAHGFASAFQTLGLNHSKYRGIIELLGYAYSVLIPLGFALIPIIMFVQSFGY
jgi:succinate dehydrogenase / fumarate reductase cytochrome b subunit